jgi:predicted MFS family arabinose efflux permease
LPMGWVADKYGRKRTLVIAWAVGALGTACLAIPGSWMVLLPGGFLALVGAGAMPALAAMVVESAPESGRRQAINLVFAAAPMGLLIGSSVGGLMAERWGLGTVSLTAALVTVAAVTSLRSLPADRPAAAAGAPLEPATSSLRLLILVGIPAAIGILLLSLPAGFMTLYLRDVVGLSLRGTGITNAQLAVGQLAWSALFAFWPGDSGRIALTIGPIRDLRMGRGTLIAIAVCLGANAAFGGLLPAGGLVAVVIALLLRGALFSLQPLGMTMVSEVTGTGGGLATRFSLLALLMGIATAVAPVIGGALYGRHPVLPFYVTGIAAAAGASVLAALLLVGRRVTQANLSE